MAIPVSGSLAGGISRRCTGELSTGDVVALITPPPPENGYRRRLQAMVRPATCFLPDAVRHNESSYSVVIAYVWPKSTSLDGSVMKITFLVESKHRKGSVGVICAVPAVPQRLRLK